MLVAFNKIGFTDNNFSDTLGYSATVLSVLSQFVGICLQCLPFLSVCMNLFFHIHMHTNTFVYPVFEFVPNHVCKCLFVRMFLPSEMETC